MMSKRPLQVVWAAQTLEDGGAHCVFDLSNSGLINGLAQLPTCSQFAYPVYASPAYEDELIAAVLDSNPRAIVWSSADWGYAIDGRNMPARFPRLTTTLATTYPNEVCRSGYCIRFKE